MENRNNNEVLRKLAEALNFSDDKMAEIFKMEGYEIETARINKLLKADDEEGYEQCSDEAMCYFLDGLITYRRGKEDDAEAEGKKEIKKLSNNTILKKLKIAFDLKAEDMIDIFNLVFFDATKQELTSIFRREGHKHYKECPDNYLINFLKGITIRYKV